MSERELLPCPFCGSAETFTKGWSGENGGSFALAGCSHCGARTQDHWPDEARAALEWNRRAPVADAGTSEAEDCPTCHGSGNAPVPHPQSTDPDRHIRARRESDYCPACGGTGDA